MSELGQMGLECDLAPYPLSSPYTGPPLHMGKKDLFFYAVTVCTGMLSWGLHVFAQTLRQPISSSLEESVLGGQLAR